MESDEGQIWRMGGISVKLLSLIVVLSAFLAGCQNNPTTPPTPTPGHYSSAPITILSGTPPGFKLGLGLDNGELWYTGGDNPYFLCPTSTAGVTGAPISVFNGGATFAQSYGVNVGPDNSLYVATGGRIEVFDSTGGYQTTINAGFSLQNAYVNSSATTLYILEYQVPPSIYAYTISGTGAGKTFSAALTFTTTASGPGALTYPFYMALDASDNVYVSNAYNVIKYSSSGTYLATINSSSIDRPSGLVVDPAGNLFVANRDSHLIQEFDPSGNAGITFGNNTLDQPSQITMDASGNIYVANYGIDQILEFVK